MFNCFYSLSRFCSDVLDLLICTFDAYFIKLFRISYFVWATLPLQTYRRWFVILYLITISLIFWPEIFQRRVLKCFKMSVTFFHIFHRDDNDNECGNECQVDVSSLRRPPKAQIPLVVSRHDTTRYLAHAFWHRKKSWRAVSRLSGSTARHARHDKRDSHDVFRGVATAWTGVDIVHLTFFQKLFLRLMHIQSTKY